MSWLAFGHFLRDVTPVVAMFTSLFLLWQGQRDRRRLTAERRRDQVDQLVLSDARRPINRAELEEALRPELDQVVSCFTVRNESKAALQVLGATEVYPTRPDLFSDRSLDNDSWPVLLAPGEKSEVLLSPAWLPGEIGIGKPYVVVLVRDAHGRLWRKRSDTMTSKQVAPDPATPPRRARLALWLQRHRLGQPFWWVLYGPLDRQLKMVRDLDPDHTAWVLRFSRLVWGRWDAGANDPWLQPGVVPWENGRREPVPPPIALQSDQKPDHTQDTNEEVSQ